VGIEFHGGPADSCYVHQWRKRVHLVLKSRAPAIRRNGAVSLGIGNPNRNLQREQVGARETLYNYHQRVSSPVVVRHDSSGRNVGFCSTQRDESQLRRTRTSGKSMRAQLEGMRRLRGDSRHKSERHLSDSSISTHWEKITVLRPTKATRSSAINLTARASTTRSTSRPSATRSSGVRA
jgi:hypothetical protein